MTIRSIANSIIQSTKDITRENTANSLNVAEHTYLTLENFKDYGFSNALKQDIINCIKPEDRTDKIYGREMLFDREIQKIDFILNVVDNSTPEELSEYVTESAALSRQRYESNKKIAIKYNDYIWKTLIMILEKDTKFKTDHENVLKLEAEIIKINIFIQACEKFEQDAVGTSHGASVISEPQAVINNWISITNNEE